MNNGGGRPDGFVALCRCGNYTGAMDLERTDRADMNRILGEWLFGGKTVEPRYGTWEQTLLPCACGNAPPSPAKSPADFFRQPPEQRAEVMNQVIDKAVERQREVVGNAAVQGPERSDGPAGTACSASSEDGNADTA